MLTACSPPPPVTCHVSLVTCPMSFFTCHVLPLFFSSPFLYKVLELVGGGSVTNGAYPF